MNVKELPPESIIDRQVQKEIFERMLQFEDDARLLAISDKADTGKSTLLRFFEYHCSYIQNVLVSLIALDEETIYSNEFDLIKGIREKLRPGPFDIFDSFENARVSFYLEHVAPNPGRTTFGGVNVGTVSGGTVGGIVHLYQIQNLGKLDLPPSRPPATAWTNPAMEKIARQKCVEAFLLDLKELCNSQPVVLLIDSWDGHRGNGELKQWILKYIIHPYCFDLKNRPVKLIIVIAGQKVPDFGVMLKDRYPRLVKLPGASSWQKDHIRDFLNLHGYGDLTEEDLDFVFRKVQHGMAVGAALKLANVFKESYDR
jgi:hypothetical protein